MATDINTQLQNISTDVTAIGNVVNRLLTIFSGGGVANPDIATAKAELQAFASNAGNINTGILALANGGTGVAATSGPDLIERIFLGQNKIGDVNTLTNTGIYTINSHESNTNLPEGTNGFLLSIKTTEGALQFFERKGTLDSNDQRLWYRHKKVTGITPWRYCLHSDMLNNEVVTTQGLNNIPISDKEFGTTTFLKSATGRDSIITITPQRFTDNNTLRIDTFTGWGGTINWRISNEDSTSHITQTLMGVYRKASNKSMSFNIQIGSLATRNEGKTGYNTFLGAFTITDDADAEFPTYSAYSPDTLFMCKIRSPLAVVGDIIPNNDNAFSLGIPNGRFTHLYAADGTIQTSDKNYKTEISDIPEAVLRAWGKVKFQQYKFKDAVEKKGSTNARIHVGVIANELVYSVIEAFKSEGLDATKYGLVGFDEWSDIYEDKEIEVSPAVVEQVKVVDKPEVKDIRVVNGVEEEYVVEQEVSHMEEQEVKPPVFKTEKVLVKPAGRIYNVRYDECLALECAYQRWQLNLIKQKLGM